MSSAVAGLFSCSPLWSRTSSISGSRVSAKTSSMASSTKVVPAIIVGGGRVGTALLDMGNGRDLMIKRGEAVPSGFPGPVLVCTRNDDLDAVLDNTPKSRWNDQILFKHVTPLDRGTVLQMIRYYSVEVNGEDEEGGMSKEDGEEDEDLVFFQNGMLEPWLHSKGLNDVEQVLAYFAVSKLGEPPVDGKTDTNPEGLTAAYGKWASAVATRLQAGGLSCKVLDKEAFQKQMLEKLIWICAFMLVGARHPGATVGVVEKEYRSEVASLISELASAAAAEKGLLFEEAMVERLCAYSRAVAHFPTAVKEFKWRNGWFYSLTQQAITEGKPDPCPLHTEWLKELKII
ncbi:hypothetical protein IFM89_005992 [Coptis chinensis]|uniref:Nuclear protein n=1 Tax=Coptis chinensis TaxID=261450 RepID=A0A835I611_9MAGN|nr:hypothetical protein IFM89_005992 [Coptis chinensis]